MSGPFKENWKRLSNRFPPNSTPSALEDKDILRVEDLAGLIASGDLGVGIHGLLSAEHSGTIPSAAVSGGTIVAVSGLWTQRTGGAEGTVMTIVGGVPDWAAAGGGAGGVVNTTLATSTTTTLGDSDYFVAVSGATTVNLPPTPSDGQRHIIKDSEGGASSVNITIAGNGALIDDAATSLLVNNYQAASLVFAAGLGRWQLI